MGLDHTEAAAVRAESRHPVCGVLGQKGRVLAAEQVSQPPAAAMLFDQMRGHLVLPGRTGAVHARADHVAPRICSPCDRLPGVLAHHDRLDRRSRLVQVLHQVLIFAGFSTVGRDQVDPPRAGRFSTQSRRGRRGDRQAEPDCPVTIDVERVAERIQCPKQAARRRGPSGIENFATRSATNFRYAALTPFRSSRSRRAGIDGGKIQKTAIRHARPVRRSRST